MLTISGELMTFVRDGVLMRQGEPLKMDPPVLGDALRRSARKTSAYVDLLAEELDDREGQSARREGGSDGER
jgi:hypothetical protein